MSSNESLSLVKSALCQVFQKCPLEHSITQSCRKLLTLKQVFSFLFPRKNESICRKQIL